MVPRLTMGGTMSASLVADNLLRPFQLERSALRGRVVRLGALVDKVLTRHDYPEPVGRLLGELLVLAATLAGALKFSGTFSLQVRSDGPVPLMLADCTNDGAMRGYARYDDARVAEASGTDARALLGQGRLAFTVDQNQSGQAYQGIVELTGATLTDCMQTYFRQSEQLRTGLKIAVDRVEAGDDGSGLLVPFVPDFKEARKEFERIYIERRLMETGGNVTRAAELLDMHRQSLQHKLRELGIKKRYTVD